MGNIDEECQCTCPESVKWGLPDCNTCVLTCEHGTLHNSNGNCYCECPPGYTGDRCDECDAEYCIHGTQGVAPDECDVCACVDGWAGARCDQCLLGDPTHTPHCATGTPNDDCSGCNCPTSGTGENAYPITEGTLCDVCSSSLCIHGTPIADSFPACRCDCPHNFEGERCDQCKSNLCSHNGVPRDNTCTSCVCDSEQNWSGTYCQECTITCQHGGSVIASTCECQCANHWTGEFCDVCPSASPNPLCSNHGVLNADCDACECDEYHTGDICDECRFDCGENGQRSEDCESCICEDGWTGDNCDVCDRSANSEYCHGRGTIVNEECDVCECENQWSPDDCSTCPIDCHDHGEANEDCSACVCVNYWNESDNCVTCDLACVNGAANDDCSACICTSGYTGLLCDYCDATDYLRQCVHDDGTLTADCQCDCLDQWTGRYCDVCELNPDTCLHGDIVNYRINGQDQCRCKCHNYWLGEQCDYCGFLLESNIFQCPDISIPNFTDCSCHCPEYYADIEGCDECIITNEDCVHVEPESSPDLTKGVCACICEGNWSGRICDTCDPELVLCEEGWELNTEICECEEICGDDLIVGDEQCEIVRMDVVDSVCCVDCHFDERSPCDDLRSCTRYDFCEVQDSEIFCQGTPTMDYTVDADRNANVPLGPLTTNHWSKWGITVTSSVAISVVDPRTLGYPSSNPCGGDIVFERVLVATNRESNANLCFNFVEPAEVQSVSVINNSKEPGASNSFRVEFYCTNTINPITLNARNYGPGSVEYIRNPCSNSLVTKICYRNFPSAAIGPVFFCNDNNGNLGRLGDYVWYDINADNLQDANELPVANVPVKLFDASTGRYLGITQTNEQGLYMFEYLYNGNYAVEFNVPQGFTFSTPVRYPYSNMLHYGTLDNNLITDSVKEILTVDAGIYLFGAIGDHIFYDISEDGIQNEAASFSLAGITLTLYRAEDLNNPIATRVTDAFGNYLFSPLPVYKTADTYQEYVVVLTPPPNSIITHRFIGGDRTIDANFDRNSGASDVILLTPQRPQDLTVDGGIFYCCGSVGDRVWRDMKTTDGIQNPLESGDGISNVRVTLFHNDVAIESQVTDSTGNYLFTGLPLSGSYYVHVDRVPGYVFTEKSKGSNRELDSDVNQNGDTDAFTLTRERPDRTDIDAGLKEGCSSSSECSSADACSTAVCNNNQCEYRTTVVCDRLSDPCVEPVCQASSGICVAVPRISTVPIPCDDGNRCTTNDVCVSGQCKGIPSDGTAFSCDDANLCTSNDHCVAGECTGTPCRENPDPCITTICDASGCKEVPAPGTPCNDNNLCTEQDVCDANGRCGGSPKVCTNNEYCREYTCDRGTGQCKPSIISNVPCSDGSPCTENDTCDSRGRCIGTPMSCTGSNPCLNYFCSAGQCTTSVKSTTTTCNDGNSCTESDRCQPDATCAGTPKNCNDGKVCTTDTCEEGTCVHRVAPDATCSDNDRCTTDVCNALTGSCDSTPMVCNDNKPCTRDTCENGRCVFTPTSAPCDDGDLCTVYDACDMDGNCKGVKRNCDDSNACTDDSCDASTGECVHRFNNIPCNDGTECSGNSYCTEGACVGYDFRECFTSNPCSVAECDSFTGSCMEGSKVDGTVCETNDLCRLNGVCVQGECQGEESVCNDNNPCTVDSCRNGECVFTHSAATNGFTCDDGDKCTERDACVYDAAINLSLCHGTTMHCDDGNVCTRDFCNSEIGACATLNLDSTVSCDDHDSCSLNDVCVEGECAGTPRVCTASTGCRVSECNALTGECDESITEGEECDDGVVCTADDVCDASGVCRGTHRCDDLIHPNPCKEYLCSDTGDCTIVNVDDDTPCDDGNACTLESVCRLGRCTGTNPFPCPSDVCNRRECVDNNGTPSCRTTFTQSTCRASSGCHDFICSQGTCETIVNTDCNAGNTNPCTRRSCSDDGTCSEENINGSCDDGNPCTDNICSEGTCIVMNEVEDCENECAPSRPCPRASNCFHYDCVNGRCELSEDSCAPSSNPCIRVECDPLSGVCVPHKKEFSRCNDNNGCTSNDICVSTGSGAEAIECRGEEVSCPFRTCEEGICNPENGQCSYQVTAGAECDDNSACTESDVCDAQANCRGTAISCDDGNSCTDDVCRDGECFNNNNSITCNDGNACTSNDLCVEGSCVGQSARVCPESVHPCKQFVCDAIAGCKEEPVEDGVTCGENEDACLLGDSVCRGGVCIPPERVTCGASIHPQCPLVCVNNECQSEPSTCTDNDGCTVDDRCTADGECVGVPRDCSHLTNGCVEGVCLLGACVAVPIQGAHECDDGDLCTNNYCADGECKSTAVRCSSNNPCEQFTCDSAIGCVASNNPVSCTPVGVVDLCVDHICIDRSCRAVPPTRACDDKNPCTLDQCFPQTGECVHTPNDLLLCSDNDPCTKDTCEAGACRSTPISCDDENLCTDDVCIGGVCVYSSNSNACPYSDGCISGGICSNERCIPHTFSPCSTENIGECQEAVCDKVTGDCVINTVSDGLTTCDDGDDCTVGDVCTSEGCQGIAMSCGSSLVECQEFHCLNGECVLRGNDELSCHGADTTCASSICVNGECVANEEGAKDCSDNDDCTYGNECTATGCSSQAYSCILSPCVYSSCTNDGFCHFDNNVASWNPLTYIAFQTTPARQTEAPVPRYYLVAVSSLTGELKGFARLSNRIVSLQVKPYEGGLYAVLAGDSPDSATSMYKVPVNASAVNVLADGVIAGWPFVTTFGTLQQPLASPDLSYKPTFVASNAPHTYSLWARSRVTDKLYSLNPASNPATQSLEFLGITTGWQAFTWDNHGRFIFGVTSLRQLVLFDHAEYDPADVSAGVYELCNGDAIIPPGTIVDMFTRYDESIVGATDDGNGQTLNVFTIRFYTDLDGTAKCSTTTNTIEKSALLAPDPVEQTIQVQAIAFDDTICTVAVGGPNSNGGSVTDSGGSNGGVSHNGGGEVPPPVTQPPPPEVVHYQGGSIPGAHNPGTTDNGVLTGGTGSVATAVVSVVGSSAVAAFAIFAVVLGINNTKKDPPANLTAALVDTEVASIASDNPLFQGMSEAGTNILA